MKKVLVMLLLVVMVLGVSACGKKDDDNSNDNNNVLLNDELNGVYGFAQEVSDNQYKIVALKDDGTSFDITDYSDMEYETLDYASGKLYMQKENNFYEIDLTKGNGLYDVNNILTYDLETPYYYKSMGVYNGKIYFNADQEKLMAYDVINDSTQEVVSEEEIVSFYVNKENGKIYYIERSDKCYLKVYDIKTGEVNTIDSAHSEVLNGYTYQYNLSIVKGGEDALIYTKEEQSDDGRITRYYRYDYENDEKILIDDSFMAGIYSDGKLYYVTPVSKEMYPDYELKVNNGNDTTVLMEEQPNNFIDFFDLGNGKIQAVMNWGQDVSTYGEQAYWIDKETLKVEETNQRYNLVYLIQEVDNKLLESSSNTSSNTDTISLDEAKEIIKDKWGKLPVDKDSPITEDGITIMGGYADMKIKDTDGLEYYVFSYDSRPEGGTLSHVQTIFIAIDGSKYKMRYIPDDFSDGDVVSDYDEEGNL